jgi:2-methylaconitate cis-trans-isomerase PrpF
MPHSCHKAHPVTGTICVASACAIEGTVASRIAPLRKAPQGVVRIEHPSGMIEVDLDVELGGAQAVIRRAALIRTARRLFQGEVLIPSGVGVKSGERTAAGAASRVAA